MLFSCIVVDDCVYKLECLNVMEERGTKGTTKDGNDLLYVLSAHLFSSFHHCCRQNLPPCEARRASVESVH